MQFETEIGGRKLIVKIDDIAGQANGAALVQYGETVVLATAVMGQENQEADYFPLSVDYEERFYAAGKIKGSRFIKRETRPPDEAILAGRLIDRAIRPFFNQDIRRPVQIIITVLAVDKENDPDIVGLYGASCALAISDIPWEGPIAGVRVGQIRGEWVLNPTYEAREKSDLDLVVCGRDYRVIMIEAQAKEISEDIMFKAVQYSLKHFEKVNKFLAEIQKKVGKKKIPIMGNLIQEDSGTLKAKKMAEDFIAEIAPKYLFDRPLKTKEARIGAVAKIKEKLEEFLTGKNIGKEKRTKALEATDKLIYGEVSRFILEKNLRIDGRKLDEIRPISALVGVLPRVHGSAMFTRGESQVLSTVTLGAPGMEQYLDTMEETGRKRYMHHYNFPPFCSGEAKPLRVTGRREIGHGALVEKGLLPILPAKDDFPYTIRLVSEVLSSNGSTSMAALCGSVMASMDAGIPIKKPVAGVAIGLASEENEKGFLRYKIITDIQDLEDGPGGMDFKVAGTKDGITAIQMDTKTKGLDFSIIKETLEAGRNGRSKILGKMKEILPAPRAELSPYAPRVCVIHIDPVKIRDVIGPGGKVINEIINKTGVTIDVEQDGTVSVTSENEESLKKAVDWIKDITRKIEPGEIFQARVTRIMDFGAFAEIVPGQEGLIHISEIAPYRVAHPGEIVRVGEVIPVKVIKIDEQGRINLSLKAVKKDYPQPRPESPGRSPGGWAPRSYKKPYRPRRERY